MKTILLLGLLLGLAACGHQSDATFDTYIESFKAAASTENTSDLFSVPIQFSEGGELGEDVNGECIQSIFSKEIKISRNSWDAASESTREQLIFHELGHCVLGRGHDANFLPNHYAESIMLGTGLPGDTAFEDNKPYYIHELFHPSN